MRLVLLLALGMVLGCGGGAAGPDPLVDELRVAFPLLAGRLQAGGSRSALTAALPQSAGDPLVLRRGALRVEIRPARAARVAGVGDGSLRVFRDAYLGTDVVQVAGADRVEEL